ncbi:RNA polymerase sigma factor [Actinomyces bowdenii]|uniref:Sigma-70 family RNA polymerase sigma factor n=1 Tax=Actinomyces bowdenii TaxID=131109 RepID=A0A853EKR9_9ACTO|nr:sigma-70 family RNA polymerase sigma factor [Actinomyces bowdenii]MBF0697676.1 sigma-70 family RNA polymerase sigma factor [Actinomyces bowdenii]MDO5064177.1 sigma-70 family RNA polymerase sigma factor [Actinomyces bowdenii]NYS69849.1 sigma-70 family RNA polymerase sigma factor [Actinomyces bowdenii]
MSRPPETAGSAGAPGPPAPTGPRPADSPVSRGIERHLVLRAQDGDPQAFEQLITRYQGRLFRTAYMILGNRQDSEDAVQEALILAWKRLHLLREPEAFHGWLLRICTNEATSAVRRRSRHRTDPHDSESLEALDSQTGDTRTSPTGGPTAADPATSNEVNAQIQALAGVLSTIRPELSIVWVLREVETMSYEEIAQTLNITVSTVRGRLARARSAVIKRMKEWT